VKRLSEVVVLCIKDYCYVNLIINYLVSVRAEINNLNNHRFIDYTNLKMSTTITHDESAQHKQHKKHSHHKFQFDFSTTEDLFISTKGRELRNKQKKLDKIVALEKQIKKGESEINDTQKEMVASKHELKTEVSELEALVELYVKSNPNY
jgi:hypothetical protein